MQSIDNSVLSSHLLAEFSTEFPKSRSEKEEMKSLQLLSFLLLSCIITPADTYGGKKKGKYPKKKKKDILFWNVYVIKKISSMECLAISILGLVFFLFVCYVPLKCDIYNCLWLLENVVICNENKHFSVEIYTFGDYRLKVVWPLTKLPLKAKLKMY